MKIVTTRFGEIEVPDESLIRFPEGIIGFPQATGFVMLECSDEGLFKWMQCTTCPDIAFVICEVRLVKPDYQIALGEKERSLLQLENAEDAAVCTILIIPDNFQDSTANLLGPIVMNATNRIGMQMVLLNPDYSTRHRLFQQTSEQSKEG